MSSSKTPPPPPSSGALDDDGEAPASDPRPSSPEPVTDLEDHGLPTGADAPLPPDEGVPAGEGDVGSPEAPGAPPVTRALTNAFLATKAALARIREVVEARVPKGLQKADVDDLVQQALVKALSTTSLARSVPGMRPWVSTIAQNTVIDRFRADAKHLKWLRRDVDVQELPPDPANDGEEEEARKLEGVPRPPAEDAPGMLARWIDGQDLSKADRVTLEMIRDHAKNGGSNTELAARFGMTTPAWENRLHRFKQKWVPHWKKHRRDRMLLLVLLGAAAVAIALAVLWWLLRPAREIRPDLSVAPRRRPAPSASADAAPPVEGRFNQAVPPQEEPEPPPGPENEKKPGQR